MTEPPCCSRSGNYLTGLYLSRVNMASAYGVAGSLAIILLWVYYSAQVFLLGAAFTRAFADEYGRPMVRKDRAEPVHPAPPAP